MHWDGGMGWWMLWGSFMMLAFWGGLIALIVWAVRSAFTPRDAARDEDEALAIARRRYAGGEIGREEFERLTSDLRRTAR